jgi:predicted  nucleic acid-binding Zn-ribbon protein
MTIPLLALQDLDLATDDLRRRLGVLPERAAAHELNEKRHVAEKLIVELEGELEKLATAEAEVEAALATVEKRAASLDDTLRSPGSATRDAQAIIHEIDHLRAQAGDLEEQGLQLLEQRDALLAKQSEQQTLLEKIAAEAPGVLAALSAAEGEAGKELAALEAKRGELAAAVAPDALQTYDRLRAKLDGVAVARVVSGACGGCHLALPATDLDRFNRLGAGEHATCEQCGRLLIRE